MRLVTASATHVGQVREINQDRALVTGTLGAVADGMGGHVGGEKAAALAIAELSGVRGAISEQRLVDVAQAANRRVFEASQAPELRGMGTTLVVASFDPNSGVVTIANIGDSRGYLYRGGEIEQITLDHSLVEELLRQGRLSEDEARNHPQRNMVTRALGIGPEIEVDVFRLTVEPGDRILLCSDGLSNEVDDDEVATVLDEVTDPREAAQQLVDRAVRHGGRDNVTVVILALDTDGGSPGTAASEDDSATDRPDDEEPLASSRDLSADPLADTKRPAKRRRVPVRGLVFVGSVLGVVAAALSATIWYARSAWYVDEIDGQVVIMRGRPDGVLWLDPTQVEVIDLTVDELDDASQRRVEDQRVLGSLDEARVFVDNLEVVGTSEG